ncbi:MAG: hypothetical protein KKD63_16855 [Proteobacteria bacterium]|nr:hypothetical protein [Desulfobulbaceae bacterium]MBU4154542.1 hypothetical protein [Pseudomonadota bacterium]
MSVFKCLAGTTRKIFSIGIGQLSTAVGAITQDGKLQGCDADTRMVRDLVRYNPKYMIEVGETQVAYPYEIHDLTGAGYVSLDDDATYELDEGAILII